MAGGFLPLGFDEAFERGEDEWFASGDDLTITRLSIERAALFAILAMLSAEPLPDLRIEP